MDLQIVGRVHKCDLTGLFVGAKSDSVVCYTFCFGPTNVTVDNRPIVFRDGTGYCATEAAIRDTPVTEVQE